MRPLKSPHAGATAGGENFTETSQSIDYEDCKLWGHELQGFSNSCLVKAPAFISWIRCRT